MRDISFSAKILICNERYLIHDVNINQWKISSFASKYEVCNVNINLQWKISHSRRKY